MLVGIVTEDPVEVLFRNLLSGSDALMDPYVVQPKQITQDVAQDALDAAEDGPDWDGFRISDVVDAELVVDPDRVTTRPPKHILEDLERLGLL